MLAFPGTPSKYSLMTESVKRKPVTLPSQAAKHYHFENIDAIRPILPRASVLVLLIWQKNKETQRGVCSGLTRSRSNYFVEPQTGLPYPKVLLMGSRVDASCKPQRDACNSKFSRSSPFIRVTKCHQNASARTHATALIRHFTPTLTPPPPFTNQNACPEQHQGYNEHSEPS